jgi:hypothetical protein
MMADKTKLSPTACTAFFQLGHERSPPIWRLIAARLFARRRREFVSAPGRRKCHGDYFVEPQLGRAQPRPTEMGRDPTTSERATDSSATRQPTIPRMGRVSIVKFWTHFL